MPRPQAGGNWLIVPREVLDLVHRIEDAIEHQEPYDEDDFSDLLLALRAADWRERLTVN